MSTIKANAVLDSSGGTTATINGYTPGPSNMQGRNKIINGAMMIDQRNAGASITAAVGNNFAVDRFAVAATQASKLTAQRSTVAPAGFINSLGITVLSSYTPVSTDDFDVRQVVEGFNVADLGWGTVNAQTVTLSFWVRSSVTGTYSLSLRNASVNRSFVTTYTINSANTFEQKLITIPGDTTGTWAVDNTAGVYIAWDLGQGSNFNTATTGSWQAGNFDRTSGSVSFVSQVNGATFYITGIQLEKGSVATPFEFRQYGTEFALCQRYYEQSGGATCVIPSNNGYSNVSFSVSKRTTPTIVLSPAITAPTVSISGFYTTWPSVTGYAYTATAEL